MDSVEYLGLVASALATLAFLPQVVKAWRTRSADDFSLVTLLMLEGGVGLVDPLRSVAARRRRSGSAAASQLTLVALILWVKAENLLFRCKVAA